MLRLHHLPLLRPLELVEQVPLRILDPKHGHWVQLTEAVRQVSHRGHAHHLAAVRQHAVGVGLIDHLHLAGAEGDCRPAIIAAKAGDSQAVSRLLELRDPHLHHRVHRRHVHRLRKRLANRDVAQVALIPVVHGHLVAAHIQLQGSVPHKGRRHPALLERRQISERLHR